jgi:uncharacterized protein YndB with AHSA1/START domain
MIFKALFGRKDPDAAEVGGTKELLTLTKRVDATPDRAFAVFVDEIDHWWPRDYTWAKENLDKIGIEPRYQGRCFEKSKNGALAVWGTVLAVERPSHIVFSWQIKADRSPEESEATSSRVDIRFAQSADGKTDVLVVHRDFFRHGGDWEKYKTDMASKKGWPYMIGLYARAVGASRE